MRAWLGIAAINGGLAVLLGAFAAHGLKARLTPDMLGVFETGARYHMYHALAMGMAALAPVSRFAQAAAILFLTGIVLFCGSLYLLAFGFGVGIVTPFGGLAFMAGWVALAVSAFQKRPDSITSAGVKALSRPARLAITDREKCHEEIREI